MKTLVRSGVIMIAVIAALTYAFNSPIPDKKSEPRRPVHIGIMAITNRNGEVARISVSFNGAKETWLAKSPVNWGGQTAEGVIVVVDVVPTSENDDDYVEFSVVNGKKVQCNSYRSYAGVGGKHTCRFVARN